MFAGVVEIEVPDFPVLDGIIDGIRWVAVAFWIVVAWISIAYWASQVAGNKGRSYAGWFTLSLLLFPVWLGIALSSWVLGLLSLPLPVVIAYLVKDRTAGIEHSQATRPRLDESVSND